MSSAEGFTYEEAATSCQEHNALLASTGELFAAWRMGFDKCRAGWLMDHSVRYPINNPRSKCGAGKSRVYTVYADSNQTSYPSLNARFDAYCFRGKYLAVDRGTSIIYILIIGFSLILTADPLLIANETGLNITDIQEVLINLTSIITLKPGT